jgi:hypothetical protein
MLLRSSRKVLAALLFCALPALGRAEPPPVPEGLAVRPIVVTVGGIRFEEVGIGLEVRHIQELIHRLFPGTDISSEFVLERLEALRGNGAARQAKVPIPENYMETDLRSAALRNGIDCEIVHFSWSQDPEDTAKVVREFKTKLAALGARAAAEGRPLHIAAHSWGSVLMHEALIELEREGRPVAVRRFVSMGSPLVPHNLLTGIVRGIEGALGRLQKRVEKPKRVYRWVNLWAEYDIFSGPIAAADENIRVDEAALSYDRRLVALLASAPDQKAVKKDLKTLRDAHAWHESYHYGIYADLPTLGETVAWEVLQDRVKDILPVDP